MAKLTGKKKAAFLARMKKGRLAKLAKKIRKTSKKTGPKQRKSQGLKRKPSPSKSMAKKKSKSRSKSRFAVPSIVKKAAAGIGLATIATVIVAQVAPQASPIVRPIAAFVGGGPVGLIADFVINGTGFLSNLFGNITGQTSDQGVLSI